MPPVDDLPKFAFHRDGGFEGWWTERPSPRVTAKAIYYISDCSVAGRGNTWVVPGSHARGAPSAGLEEVRGLDEATGQPEGAIPVRCRPGDALMCAPLLPFFAVFSSQMRAFVWGAQI